MERHPTRGPQGDEERRPRYRPGQNRDVWQGWAALGVVLVVAIAAWAYFDVDPSALGSQLGLVQHADAPSSESLHVEEASSDTRTTEEKYDETPGSLFVRVEEDMARAEFLVRKKFLEFRPRLAEGEWTLQVQAPVRVHSGDEENMWATVLRIRDDEDGPVFRLFYEPTDSGYQPPEPKQWVPLDRVVDWFAISEAKEVHGLYRARFMMNQRLEFPGEIAEPYRSMRGRFVDTWMPADGAHPDERRNR